MPDFKTMIKGMEEQEKPEPKMNQKLIIGAKPDPNAPKPKMVNQIAGKPNNPNPESPKETNVRAWVKKNYPTEFQTENIRGDLTFDDLYKHMQESENDDFYEFASEGGKGFDSEVREEIFNGLSGYHGKPYDHFYDLWLNGGKQKEDNESEAIYQKYLKMGYDKSDAQAKTARELAKKEDYKKEDDLQKLASVSSAFIDNGEAKIYTTWTRNPRNNYKNYIELRSYLNKKYGEGNYAIDYIRDETRDNGRETAAELRVRFF